MISTHTVSNRSKRSYRIALFTGNYVHIRDGVSLTLNRLVRYLLNQGHEVLVFGPSIKDAPMDPEGHFIPVPSITGPIRREYRITRCFPRKARTELAEFQPDLIHIATPDFLGYRALQLAKSNEIPIVASFHTNFAAYLKYYHLGIVEPLVWQYLRRFYKQCEEVYVPSPSMISVLKQKGVDTVFRVWARGIETDSFSPAHRSDTWRKEKGLTKPTIAFVSRLVWEKGLDVFAQVIERLERVQIPHCSVVVGDGPARKNLEARLPNTLFCSHLEGLALATAYASSDIFLFPSNSETFGSVTLEAMASGLPVVCADANGSRDLVEENVTGYLCSTSDVDEFCEKVIRLIEDESLRARMGTSARQMALAYDWEVIMENLARYYEGVLGATRLSTFEKGVRSQAKRSNSTNA
ncbi:MAG: glycosyltransferase family 1 protein [Rubricoccaceae bacterium]|nr:glycosyltransferase family 1 protein [Rubricoccaceae bacterium]